VDGDAAGPPALFALVLPNTLTRNVQRSDITTRKKTSSKVTRESMSTSNRSESPQPSSPLVFISHDSRDAELAEAFSKLLSGISAGILKSFRSSDKKGVQGIEFGVEWYPEVMTKIDSASDVVCLLTPLSLERPWILYEAGVAKGKMNVPVFGVALGISLAKASTGPFALFQNCGDDADSLTKLVTQLMCRIPGAEPDQDTVKMQVEVFKSRAVEIQKASETESTKSNSASEPEESVAKLFEEVKVMFRDLRIESRMDSPRRRKRRIDPEFLFHMAHRLGGPKNDDVGLLVLTSMFKDDLPWLYEMGLEVYRNTVSGLPSHHTGSAIERLRMACDAIVHEPMFREMARDEETMMAVLELRSFLEHWERSPTRLHLRARKKNPESPDL
jgi:hypothetical protein